MNNKKYQLIYADPPWPVKKILRKVRPNQVEMRRLQREPYYILTRIGLPNGGNPIMCSFCKFSEWRGWCGDTEVECGHPLSQARYCPITIEDEVNNAMMMGGDCFLFRPCFSPEVAADIVGIWLQDKQPDWKTVPMLGEDRELKPTEDKEVKDIIGICSRCGAEIPNGTGSIKLIGNLPSWGSILCSSCTERKRKETK